MHTLSTWLLHADTAAAVPACSSAARFRGNADWQASCGLASEAAGASLLMASEEGRKTTARPHSPDEVLTVLRDVRHRRRATIRACRSGLVDSDLVVLQLPFVVSKSTLERFLDWEDAATAVQVDEANEDPPKTTMVVKESNMIMSPAAQTDVGDLSRRLDKGAICSQTTALEGTNCRGAMVDINSWLEDAQAAAVQSVGVPTSRRRNNKC